MQYFILKLSTETKVIGSTFPQCQSFMSDGNYKVTEPYYYGRIQPFLPTMNKFKFPKFKLHSKAKRTDLLSVINIRYGSLILTESLKNTINKYKIPKYESRSISILKQEKEYSYHFIHFMESQDSLISFPLSEFELRYKYKVTEESVNFESYDDFASKKEKLKKELGISSHYRAKKIVFNETQGFDLMMFKSVYDVIIISQKLADSIIKEKITGVSIIPIKEYKKTEFIFEN